ncbi:MAG: Ig-like domain-containing protein [Clostridiales bacterium]|jgi:uncharacterized protein YjdB|nr:Ig-like domain-containing protein [Clostridiales bacterium]
MKLILKEGRRARRLALALILTAALFAAGLCGSAVTAFGVTTGEAAALVAVHPDSLDPMTRVGENALVNPNFADGSAIPRTQYGGPWAFTNNDELGVPANAATFGVTEVTDAVAGMGAQSGLGTPVSTGLKIDIVSTNFSAMDDSLTYSQFDDTMYGDRATDAAWYFAAWVKADQDMWFDVGISYSAKQSNAGVYFDLGRKFFVPAGVWTQIGKDSAGNFVPFRSRVIGTGYLRGTGSDPTANNSNSATEALNAKEDAGDTTINPWYRSGWSEIWACLRIYAYAGSKFGDTGVGTPTGGHALTAGDSYTITGTNFWNYSSEPPYVAKEVETVTLNKNELALEVGQNETLTAEVLPADADDSDVLWSSSDTTVATVDQTGKVTAIAVGTATVTAEANDGGGAQDECAVTVSAATEPPVSVTGVTLDKTTGSVKAGETLQLTATVAPAGAENKAVTWASSDTAVATVDANGKVTAVKAGTATITVTTADGSKTATCTVTVTAAEAEGGGCGSIASGFAGGGQA